MSVHAEANLNVGQVFTISVITFFLEKHSQNKFKFMILITYSIITIRSIAEGNIILSECKTCKMICWTTVFVYNTHVRIY